MGISKRLKLIANLVTIGNRVADIGTDHGYVPIYLLRNNISPYAIAADISEPTLQKAKENISKARLTDNIRCVLSDGLSNIKKDEADTLIIAGMGGILIDKILRADIDKTLSFDEIILAPHRDVGLIHKFAEEFSCSIIFDNTILDKNKYYNIIKLKVCKN